MFYIFICKYKKLNTRNTFNNYFMVNKPPGRIELPTFGLQDQRTATVLRWQWLNVVMKLYFFNIINNIMHIICMPPFFHFFMARHYLCYAFYVFNISKISNYLYRS